MILDHTFCNIYFIFKPVSHVLCDCTQCQGNQPNNHSLGRKNTLTSICWDIAGVTYFHQSQRKTIKRFAVSVEWFSRHFIYCPRVQKHQGLVEWTDAWTFYSTCNIISVLHNLHVFHRPLGLTTLGDPSSQVYRKSAADPQLLSCSRTHKASLLLI